MAKKDRIIIVGGGGHAKVLISIIKKNANYEIVGYVDIENKGEILGVEYLGTDKTLDYVYKKDILNMAMGIGEVDLNNNRKVIIERMKGMGFYFPVIISKNAIINENIELKEGTQVFDGVVINSGTKIGEFCIINTNVTVEHDCVVGDYCHIASGSTICGGVEIGDFSMVGANAVILQYKKIISGCMIGAGSVVTKNINSRGTYYGVPAKELGPIHKSKS